MSLIADILTDNKVYVPKCRQEYRKKAYNGIIVYIRDINEL